MQARLNEQIAKSLGFCLDSRITTHEERSARSRGASTRRNSQLRGQGGSSGSKIQEQQDNGNDDDDDDIEHDDDYPGAGEFEFRLFSSRPPTKVTLEDDDTATAREGAIVNPRPPSFYLASHMPPTLNSEYRVAAVSGEDVVLQSHRPAWGMAYPWRVVTGVYSVTRRARGQDVWSARLYADPEKKVDADAGADGETRRRKRPGKKSRIANRQKVQAERQRQEMEKKKAMDKEELVKEKKKRLNRLKKLRKRAKNKEMKAGGREDDGESDGDGNSGDE